MAERIFTQAEAQAMARRLQRSWELSASVAGHLDKVNALAVALREFVAKQKNADPVASGLAQTLMELTASYEGLYQLSDMLSPEA